MANTTPDFAVQEPKMSAFGKFVTHSFTIVIFAMVYDYITTHYDTCEASHTEE